MLLEANLAIASGLGLTAESAKVSQQHNQA